MFPQEIYDHIIDSVHDNPTLVSCALVSRNWHPRSRHRFFQDSRIPIDSVDKCQNLVSLACRPVAGCRPITQYVRHVEILLPLQDKNSQYCQSETYEDLYDALSQLTRLTSLIFNYEFTMVEYAKSWHCDMYPIFDADFLDGLIPILRNSDTFNALRIGSYIRFPDIPHLDKLLTALPNLKSFQTAGVRFDNSPFLSQTPAELPYSDAEMKNGNFADVSYSLTDLAIEATCQQDVAAVVAPVMKLQNSIRLSTLHLIIRGDNYAVLQDSLLHEEMLQKFFRSSCVANLDDLSLCYHPTSQRMGLGFVKSLIYSEGHPDYVDLSQMTQLKTLRLNLPEIWLPRILSSVSSPSLQALFLVVRGDYKSKGAAYFTSSSTEWKQCDEILARLSCSSSRDPADGSSLSPPPLVVMLALLEDVPLIGEPAECEHIFASFEHLRSGGHHIGVRSYQKTDMVDVAQEVWCDNNPPPAGRNFLRSGPADRAGYY